MQATIQFTMDFVPRYGILLLDDFIDDFNGLMQCRYGNPDTRFFESGDFSLRPCTRVVKLIQDGYDERCDERPQQKQL